MSGTWRTLRPGWDPEGVQAAAARVWPTLPARRPNDDIRDIVYIFFWESLEDIKGKFTTAAVDTGWLHGLPFCPT